jgi:hypothetical protein
MLFVNHVRNRAKQAMTDLVEFVQNPDNSIESLNGEVGISTMGESRLENILTSMNWSRYRPESDNLHWNHWHINPEMPKAVKSDYMYAPTAEQAKTAIEWLKRNRLDYIVWSAFVYEIKNMLDTPSGNLHEFPMATTSNCEAINVERWRYAILSNHYSTFKNNLRGCGIWKALEALSSAKIHQHSYTQAIRSYTEKMSKLSQFVTNNKMTGLHAIFEGRPTIEHDEKAAVREAAIKLFDEIQNSLSCRTWGFEIEVPDAKGVEAPYGVEKGTDGSLRSDSNSDCECDCNDCAYHECNCDNCEYGSDDPDHCGNDECSGADMAEYRSTGGIQRVLHAGMIKLCDDLVAEDAEINSSAGTHIHVYAQDLTTNQVGQVLAIYHWLYNIVFTPIAGRLDNQYAMPLRVEDISNALRKSNPVLRPQKPLVVNVSNLINSSRGTIEFRQQNCNLNSKRISVWAWLVRGLVEIAKRGATFGDFKKCESLDDVIKVYAKYNFTVKSENPGLLIPGSKSDLGKVKVYSHLTGIAS